MLKNIAVALLAATIFTAPALARSGSNALRSTGHATVVAPAGHVKAFAPVKFVRHIKKHKRHRHHFAHVRHLNAGKALTAAPGILPAKKGART